MATQILMNISDNQGYAPDQIDTRFTLGDLLEQVEQAIEDFGEEATIVLNNGQRYGASYGSIADPRGGYLFYSAADEQEDY